MRNKRRERYEDKRLNWRDPDMPVFTLCDLKLEYPDGRIEFKNNQMLALTPKQRQQASINSLKECTDPLWRDDPTYFPKRRKYNG